MIFQRNKQVITDIQDVSAVWAHALRTVNIAIGGITDTAACLLIVPTLEREGNRIFAEVLASIIIVNSAITEIFNVFTCAMARAVIWTGCSSTSLAFITIKTLAFACLTIANAAIGAFSILVKTASFVGGVNPSDLIGTNTFRTITRIVGETKAPIIITFTDIIGHTGAMTTALIITSSTDGLKLAKAKQQ